ncbi:MAG: inorganic phosphate transporter [Bacteroidales bacterium]|nr:inorganic phosphate transporter [Bacteroidales bacterium]
MLFLVFISSGLFLGWSLGANDASNIFGSAVGSKMLSFRNAAIIASIFVVIGAVFQGRGGSETLNQLGSVDALGGAFTVALCAAFIVFIMTQRSLPVSTSQAIVGAIIGWSAFTGNPTDYKVLGKIMGSWVSGPLLGMLFAAGLFVLMRWFLRKSKIHVIKLDYYIRIGLIVVGAFGAYSLGANNIANVMGVFFSSAPSLELDFGILTLDGVQILFLLGGLAIALGIFTYSKRVMNKVGNGILSLTPEAAIVVVLAHSLVLFIFSAQSLATLISSLGLPPLPMVPVSSTQVVIGSLLGIGMVKGVREIKFKALWGVAIGWILTPIAAGVLTYVVLFFVQNVFNMQVTLSRLPETIAQPRPAELQEAVEKINMVLPGIFIAAAAIIIVLVVLYFNQQKLRMKAENELLFEQNQSYTSQKVLNELALNVIQMENELLNSKLESKRREFINVALNITEQRSFLDNVATDLDHIIKESDHQEGKSKLAELLLLIKQKMSFSTETAEFYTRIEKIHKDFQTKLEAGFPDLTDQEKRLATLLRVNLSTKEIASLMNITPKSVEIARYRLRKKLKLTKGDNLIQYLTNL